MNQDEPMSEYEALQMVLDNVPLGTPRGKRALATIERMRDERRPVAVGDFVRVLRGCHNGAIGRVERVTGTGNLETFFPTVQGSLRTLSIPPSNVERIEPTLDDLIAPFYR